MNRICRIVPLLVCALALAPSAADAAVTTSAINSPSDPSYPLQDRDNGGGTITVSGTSNGTSGDHVDIDCYTGGGAQQSPLLHVLQANVPVVSGGAFGPTSVSIANPSDLYFHPCVLRAVPAGDTTVYVPGSPSQFTGPRLFIGAVATFRIPSGPNAGAAEDYLASQPTMKAVTDLFSVGECSLCDYALIKSDQTLTLSQDLFYDNGSLYGNNDNTSGTSAGHPTGSEVRIDGVDAYDANVAFGNLGGGGTSTPNGTNFSGFPALSFTRSVDVSENLAVGEHSAFAFCADASGQNNTYPPTTASCTRFLPAPVTLDRTWATSADGTVVTQTDRIRSTDGHSHTLSLAYFNDYNAPKFVSSTDHTHDVNIWFPWAGSGFADFAGGATVAGAPAGVPATIFVKGDAATPPTGDGDALFGAETIFPAPSGISFWTGRGTTQNSSPALQVGEALSVPATGAATTVTIYSAAFTLADAQAAAASAQAGLVAPVLTVSVPAGDVTVGTASVTVSGAAKSANPAIVTINGAPVTLGPGGVFSALEQLKRGANMLTFVATNSLTGLSSTVVRLVLFTSSDFTLGKPSVKRNGTIVVTVGALEAGRVTATASVPAASLAAKRCRPGYHRVKGRCVKLPPAIYGKAAASAAKAGPVTLTIAPSAAARRKLAKGGRLHVQVSVTFAASTGATPVTKAVTVTVTGHKRSKKHT